MKKKIIMSAVLSLVAFCIISGQVYADGYEVINSLRIHALIHSENGPIGAAFHKGGEDTTARGDSVIWGYFYADPADVSWGSENNPEVYVKIWFDITGRIDVSFFHVSVPDITVFSDYPRHGTTYDRHDRLTTENRHIRHEYRLIRLITSYSYNAGGDLSEVKYDRDGDGSPDAAEHYTYTREENKTAEKTETDEDADGIPDRSRTEIRTYDPDGNLIKTESGSYAHTYTYDDRGNLIKEMHEKDGTVYSLTSYSLTYADGNIIKKEADIGGDGTADEVFIYTYDADGNMTEEEHEFPPHEIGPFETRIHSYIYTYDDRGRTVKKESADKDGNIMCSVIFTYDERGNLIKDEPGSDPVLFAFDDLGNLIRAEPDDGSGYGNRGKIYSPHTTYTYDPEGRLIKKVSTGYWGGECPESYPMTWDEKPVGVYETEDGLVTTVSIPNLPESGKGYELYSWISEDRWYFTLITGTDRVKTYREVCSGENTVSEDGWVKITVRGAEALRYVLSRLPWKKETLSWPTGKLGGEQGDMPDLSLPDPETVAEIRAYCEDMGITADF